MVPMTPIVLIVVGVVTLLVSIIFAILNLTSKLSSDNFDNKFKKHGFAMIGMFIGGITAVTGFVWILISIAIQLMNS